MVMIQYAISLLLTMLVMSSVARPIANDTTEVAANGFEGTSSPYERWNRSESDPFLYATGYMYSTSVQGYRHIQIDFKTIGERCKAYVNMYGFFVSIPYIQNRVEMYLYASSFENMMLLKKQVQNFMASGESIHVNDLDFITGAIPLESGQITKGVVELRMPFVFSVGIAFGGLYFDGCDTLDYDHRI
jgi:hypothetical protein